MFESHEIDQMRSQLPTLDGSAGTRNLLQAAWCIDLAHDPRIASTVSACISQNAVPVRAILFDKSCSANWSLGWHQDTKIAVRRRVDIPGFTAWSEKEGVVHCQPPAAILESSIAVRIHLDRCDASNGPLRVIPGSHLYGIQPALEERSISDSVECLAEVGDVLLIKPLLWHASSKSSGLSPHRRVIHIEYCSADLPDGLEWAY